MTSWNDFNSADDQNSFGPIPKNTLVKVRMTLRPGGYDDASQGWAGGYATQSETTGSVYLSAEFVEIYRAFNQESLQSLTGLFLCIPTLLPQSTFFLYPSRVTK